jgi:hypothetical protein
MPFPLYILQGVNQVFFRSTFGLPAFLNDGGKQVGGLQVSLLDLDFTRCTD